MEEKKLTDELEEMYVSGKFNGEIIFNAIKTIYALQGKNAEKKAEIEKLHTLTDMQEANVNKMFENNMELRKEIERLIKENEGQRKIIEYQDSVEDKNAELQKQVDELKDICLDCPYKLKFDEIEKQAIKDTARKFARLVEFHSVATMENGVEYFTISSLGLSEILHENFGVEYSNLYPCNGVEVE